MRKVLIVQARMNSSRLPGKVLKDLHGRPMLEWVVLRGQRAHEIDSVIVATTDSSSDDPIREWCTQNDVACYSGSEFDVLDRFYQAAKQEKADLVVRITADCPLIDPQVIDDVIDLYISSGADFAANRLVPPWHRTFPIGLDTEVVSFENLEKAWKQADQTFEREHVMPWFYDTEGRCKIEILEHDPDCGMHRWTVDTPDDLELLRQIFSLMKDPLHDSWQDVLSLIETHPALERINASVHAKRVDVVDERQGKKQ